MLFSHAVLYINITIHSTLHNMHISLQKERHKFLHYLKEHERERGKERGRREREEGGGKRDRVANSRYYVGSFRCESIWQIGQSLRGQNFSSGCDDGMRGCWSEGVVSGCTRMMEGETV